MCPGFREGLRRDSCGRSALCRRLRHSGGRSLHRRGGNLLLDFRSLGLGRFRCRSLGGRSLRRRSFHGNLGGRLRSGLGGRGRFSSDSGFRRRLLGSRFRGGRLCGNLGSRLSGFGFGLRHHELLLAHQGFGYPVTGLAPCRVAHLKPTKRAAFATPSVSQTVPNQPVVSPGACYAPINPVRRGTKVRRPVIQHFCGGEIPQSPAKTAPSNLLPYGPPRPIPVPARIWAGKHEKCPKSRVPDGQKARQSPRLSLRCRPGPTYVPARRAARSGFLRWVRRQGHVQRP